MLTLFIFHACFIRFVQFPRESLLWEDIQNLTVALEESELDPSKEFLKGSEKQSVIKYYF